MSHIFHLPQKEILEDCVKICEQEGEDCILKKSKTAEVVFTSGIAKHWEQQHWWQQFLKSQYEGNQRLISMTNSSLNQC